MKKTLLITAFLFSIFTVNAQQSQTASVEQSMYGIQTGFLGVWIHNETKLSNSIALRSEIGLDAVLFAVSKGLSGQNYDDTDVNYLLTPVISLEPRWYYNLDKRLSKGKSIGNNSGNFVGLSISFNPDLFTITNVDKAKVLNQIFIIPKWGIKRTIGEHFTYEAAIGVGYHHTFIPDNQYYEREDESETALDLHIRIGYTF